MSCISGTIEIRELTSAELEASGSDIHVWLEVEGDVSLVHSYPQVFRPEGEATSLGAWQDGELCSHAAYRRVTLIGDEGPFSASMVGAVATNPRARKQGLASQLLSEIADHEGAAGQNAILLWSDLWEFYSKLGYAPVGIQAELVIGAQELSLRSGIRRAEARDLLALYDLHCSKPWRVERSLGEMALLLAVPGMDCIVWERDGEIIGYICHGKGVDFQGWYHELGGKDKDLAVLIPAAMEILEQDEVTVLIPPYRIDLCYMLERHMRLYTEGVVALRKPLTAKGACELFIDGLDSI